jgi:hypothetical protein
MDEQRKANFMGAHLGIFHKWGVFNGNTIGIIESTEGTVFICVPEHIRFADSYRVYAKRKRLP